jgi:Gene product 88
MEIRRGLLQAGNEKLSQNVFHFDLPAGVTCPGKSGLCYRRCYARRSRFAFPQVVERLKWCYEQSKRDDFVSRMVDELYRKGVLLMRWHVAGDIYSPGYAKKIVEVVEQSPHATFWLYTRSWRIPTILPVLHELSELPNMKLWLSADTETGYPVEVPENARVAWMSVKHGDDAGIAELVFLDLPLRKTVPLDMLERVCPTETPEGKAKGTTCSTCQFCWKD